MPGPSECCLRGFEWDGTPIGKEAKLADNNAYITGSNSKIAIMVIADLFGWNTRLLSDHYAKEADATVYLPDFFGGEVIDSEILAEKGPSAFDLKSWVGRNGPEMRWPEILSHDPPLVNCVSTAHPTWLSKEYIDDIGVPVQIVAPEHDETFTPELKKYANDVIPTKGLPYDYQYFSGVSHAFATRGNPKDVKERRAMVRAKNAQVSWMKEWLHGEAIW
ncbi:dienelactone hydrolase family protein [Rhizodiscina lignyota]|uniref:Dienelactone hydrolase family protein n=1 Tax=Rhizodiscina lignyota TaxID=1504668 RepID=A0A9P4IJK1_9PEZI|nr:dienelactone hydrolase family protein [Rhizodiscina lignyota]